MLNYQALISLAFANCKRLLFKYNNIYFIQLVIVPWSLDSLEHWTNLSAIQKNEPVDDQTHF
jgi:hypothetical protein